MACLLAYFMLNMTKIAPIFRPGNSEFIEYILEMVNMQKIQRFSYYVFNDCV